jgi:hypothetical protein
MGRLPVLSAATGKQSPMISVESSSSFGNRPRSPVIPADAGIQARPKCAQAIRLGCALVYRRIWWFASRDDGGSVPLKPPAHKPSPASLGYCWLIT